jgi:hypothetical protein
LTHCRGNVLLNRLPRSQRHCGTLIPQAEPSGHQLGGIVADGDLRPPITSFEGAGDEQTVNTQVIEVEAGPIRRYSRAEDYFLRARLDNEVMESRAECFVVGRKILEISTAVVGDELGAPAMDVHCRL